MIDLDKVIDSLIKLVQNKYDSLNDIYNLTKQQSECIDDNNIDKLAMLIDEKQEQIDFVRNIDSQFEAIVDDLKTLYDIKSLDELDVHSENLVNLKEDVASVMGLLKSILTLEAVNRDKISSSKRELEVRMENAKNGKKAIKQYGGVGTYTDSFFFDKKIR